MTYFNHYEVTPDLGLREAIDKILASDCVTGDGIEKESNYYELEAWKLDSLVPADVRWGMANSGSHATAWKLAPKVTSEDLAQIIEAVEWLVESPILSDSRYSDMIYAEVDRQLVEIANEYGVDPEVFAQIARIDYDIYGETENGEVYVPLTTEVLDHILDQTKRDSQTSNAHYYGGQYHEPTHCDWCQEFPQLIGARAS